MPNSKPFTLTRLRQRVRIIRRLHVTSGGVFFTLRASALSAYPQPEDSPVLVTRDPRELAITHVNVTKLYSYAL
jgi:hypothetical protein